MIDINAASAEEIDAVDQLSGHGLEIVRYRGERGRFDELPQLEEVPGLAGKVAGLDGMIRSQSAPIGTPCISILSAT